MPTTFADHKTRARIAELTASLARLDETWHAMHDELVANRARAKAIEDEIVALERRLR